MSPLPRRNFLGLGAAAVLGLRHPSSIESSPQAAVPDDFPRQPAALVQEIVGASHGNLARVRELISRQPALATASVDWGFGDWETALGAAAHTGRREIAELLIENGAEPTLFSAAMLGQLAVVQALIESRPGLQRQLGPHGIPLLAHARAGGDPARTVVQYLERFPDANGTAPALSLTPAQREAYAGTYAFGSNPNQRLQVTIERESVAITRPGRPTRTLRPVAEDVFHPVGAESVRVRFTRSSNMVSVLEVLDPDVIVRANRM